MTDYEIDIFSIAYGEWRNIGYSHEESYIHAKKALTKDAEEVLA